MKNVHIKRSILFTVLLSLFSSLSAQYSVRGGSGNPYLEVDNTQIKVYLLNGLSNAQISFTSTNPETHQWYQYNKDNPTNLIPVSSVQEGNTSYITDVRDGYGYFVSPPSDEVPLYVWIIDYSLYVPRFFNLEAVEEEDKCTFLKISVDMEAAPLTYYLPTGFSYNLSRIFHLRYDTQVWIDDDKQFVPEEKDITLGWFIETVIDAPLTNTWFNLSGDQFAEHFGIPQIIRSDEYRAIAIEVHSIAETTKEYADNEIHLSGDVLGGSAPVEYTFTAYANEPVVDFYIWKILQRDSITGEMSSIFRHNDKVLRYNFERDGIYQVELEVRDSQLICVDTTQVFPVMINSTVVRIPNAFSPGSSIGVNDELKIAFTSIISFKASVFNRWGNLLFQWSDPTKGWDGRVNGTFVPTGVYYVIVEYKDSNGKARTASRAVNVLRTKN